MLDRAIGIIGLVLAVFFGLAPYAGLKMPTWAAQAGIAVGILLLGLAAGLIIADRRNPEAETLADTADLQIHIYADTRTPTRLSYSNIWRWYYMKQVLVQLSPDTGAEQRRNLTATLFLTFDTPVKIGTLEVSSPDIQLPLHEVKDFNNRSAVIFFGGDVPEGTLNVSVHQ
jgi:hypothetical protein